MTDKTSAQVSVSKMGPFGRPVAQVMVEGAISAQQLGSLMQHVTSNAHILQVAGLRACGGCKSGLDINIIDRAHEVIQVEI